MSNERYLKIVTDLTVELPVTLERKWASFQVTRHTQLVGWVDHRLFHSDSATVSQCDNFCCYMYSCVWNLTSQRWRVFFFFLGGGGGGGGGTPVYLVFGVVYWSRPPRVLRRFTALLFFNENFFILNKIFLKYAPRGLILYWLQVSIESGSGFVVDDKLISEPMLTKISNFLWHC